MSTCQINRESVSKGIKTSVKNKLKDSKVFSEKNDIFYPLGDADYQSVVDDINDSYGDELVMPMNTSKPQFAIVEPSDRLVTNYLNNLPEDVETELRRMTKSPQFKAWFGDWELLKE